MDTSISTKSNSSSALNTSRVKEFFHIVLKTNTPHYTRIHTTFRKLLLSSSCVQSVLDKIGTSYLNEAYFHSWASTTHIFNKNNSSIDATCHKHSSVIKMNYFIFNTCMDEHLTRRYNSFRNISRFYLRAYLFTWGTQQKTSYVCNIMYVFLRRCKKYFHLLVMWYELVHCQEISWYSAFKFTLLVQMRLSIKTMILFSKWCASLSPPWSLQQTDGCNV